MGVPERGDLVVVSFPFSDLIGSKFSPALIVGEASKGDLILCQLTSQSYHDEGIEIDPTTDVSDGKLRGTSFARPGKLFTANRRIVKGVIGTLSAEKFADVVEKIVEAVDPAS